MKGTLKKKIPDRFKCKNKTTKILNESTVKYFYNTEVRKTFLITD